MKCVDLGRMQGWFGRMWGLEALEGNTSPDKPWSTSSARPYRFRTASWRFMHPNMSRATSVPTISPNALGYAGLWAWKSLWIIRYAKTSVLQIIVNIRAKTEGRFVQQPRNQHGIQLWAIDIYLYIPIDNLYPLNIDYKTEDRKWYK